MSPFVPYHNSAGQSTIVKFGGLLTTEFLEPPPGRCFLFRQTYRHNVEGPIPENLRKLINSPKKPKGPPAHLHRFQTEYFRVESGIMGICIDGKHMKFTPADGEFTVRAGIIHQFYIHPDSPEAMTIYISASDSGKDRELDRVFFENWYGYWHDALLQGKGLNLLQVLAIHDGGDAYLVAPKWVPFRRQLAYYGGIILGRWIGGLLGYQPFYREYTTDWDFAVAKMEGSFFQRRFAKKAYKSKKSWAQQRSLEAPVKPYNADLEPLTTDLDPMPLSLGPAAYEGGRYKGKTGDSTDMVKMNGLNGLH